LAMLETVRNTALRWVQHPGRNKSIESDSPMVAGRLCSF
jgi:hypothetical protein